MKKISAANKLKNITDLLIPTMEVVTDDTGNRMLVDRSLYSVISSCLSDLKQGTNDELTQKSLEECLLILEKVHGFLNYKRLPNEDVSDIEAILVDFRLNT